MCMINKTSRFKTQVNVNIELLVYIKQVLVNNNSLLLSYKILKVIII